MYYQEGKAAEQGGQWAEGLRRRCVEVRNSSEQVRRKAGDVRSDVVEVRIMTSGTHPLNEAASEEEAAGDTCLAWNGSRSRNVATHGEVRNYLSQSTIFAEPEGVAGIA